MHLCLSASGMFPHLHRLPATHFSFSCAKIGPDHIWDVGVSSTSFFRLFKHNIVLSGVESLSGGSLSPFFVSLVFVMVVLHLRHSLVLGVHLVSLLLSTYVSLFSTS